MCAPCRAHATTRNTTATPNTGRRNKAFRGYADYVSRTLLHLHKLTPFVQVDGMVITYPAYQ